MEDRFGSSQVASVGTVTTFKAKGMIKDFDRQLDNDIMRANVITSIVEADDSVRDIFKRSVSEPKLKSYIKDNPDIFYMMDNIMGQNKTQSIRCVLCFEVIDITCCVRISLPVKYLCILILKPKKSYPGSY